jgi:predicted nuclease of predicted toxin-antitoxin system
MKLLFDQNISYRIIKIIAEVFPDAKQVKELGLEGMKDKQLWDYAKNNNYTIVTFDADFFDLSNLYGFPPKIIWLRTGNKKISELARLLLSKKEIIKVFLENSLYNDFSCLEIYD